MDRATMEKYQSEAATVRGSAYSNHAGAAPVGAYDTPPNRRATIATELADRLGLIAHRLSEAEERLADFTLRAYGPSPATATGENRKNADRPIGSLQQIADTLDIVEARVGALFPIIEMIEGII